jgi:DNA-binding CsgD family transcriptional regulator
MSVSGRVSEIQPIRNGRKRRLAALSPREREVVATVLRGHTNREVAAVCEISVQTVKNHLTRAFLKLGVRNRLQLALWALEAPKR